MAAAAVAKIFWRMATAHLEAGEYVAAKQAVANGLCKAAGDTALLALQRRVGAASKVQRYL